MMTTETRPAPVHTSWCNRRDHRDPEVTGGHECTREVQAGSLIVNVDLDDGAAAAIIRTYPCGREEVTPDQARRMAAALIEAAHIVEAGIR